jgi:O-6-methylguanine DNA methyltransferase
MRFIPEDSDEALEFRHSPFVAHAIIRWRRLVARLRPDTGVSPRVWARRQWPGLTALALALAATFATDAWLGSCGFRGCPSPEEIRAFRPAQGGRILDRNGTMIARVTPVHRVNVPLSKIPVQVRAAFVATEDRRFYEHGGLDWRAVLRAASRNVGALGVREGFSTITMQVARNGFVAGQYGRRTFSRKLMELRLARLIETSLTKDQILELYLNVIYLGNGAYGVEAASRDLFGKSIADVDLAEAALLAALPKGPSSYAPRRAPDRALRRRNLVLALMTREGYVARGDAERATREPLHVSADGWHPGEAGDSYALDAVRALVDSVVPSSLRDADLTVVTTIDARAQRAAEAADRLGRRDDPGFADVAAQLREYFAGDRSAFDLPIRPSGNDFLLAVLEQMTRIPYGETRSYGELARALGDRTLAQAVGVACGRNPLPVLIPCHRVIGADGNLVGFGGGLERKRLLLDLEQRGQRLF